MVWFECKACSQHCKDVPEHTQYCSSQRFFCLNCGMCLYLSDVQGHTQCTERSKFEGSVWSLVSQLTEVGETMKMNKNVASNQLDHLKDEIDVLLANWPDLDGADEGVQVADEGVPGADEDVQVADLRGVDWYVQAAGPMPSRKRKRRRKSKA